MRGSIKILYLIKLIYYLYFSQKQISMKQVLKELAIFTYEMSFFTLISVPLAIVLFLSAHFYFETKRIYKWITN